MKILAEAGLVRSNRVGSETIYVLTPQSLALTSEWVTAIMAQWDARLQKLYECLVDEEVMKRRRERRQKHGHNYCRQL